MRYWVLILAVLTILFAIGCSGGSASRPSAYRGSGDQDRAESGSEHVYGRAQDASGAVPSEPNVADSGGAYHMYEAEESDGLVSESLPKNEGRQSALRSLGYIFPGESSPDYISGGSGQPNDEPYDLTFFENYGVNPFVSTDKENTSTFGMDVDTASYTVVRRYIMDRNMPDPDSIRTEEFINYFEQNYEEPEGRNVFGITLEGAESWFGQPSYHLLKIGVKARDISREARPAANMVFVVDVSGSMDREDRLQQVKRSLRMLAGDLKRGDRVGLVVYGSQGEVISEMTSNIDKILESIDRLVAGGSTYAEDGLRLGYQMARDNYEEGKINRIILCSDGVANVGLTDADSILEQIKADAQNGITLTCLGFGMGNYNDVLMEQLANHGDGLYYYIDSDDEAKRLFEDGASQMLVLLGADAKIQVVFNEEVVESFRLIGYENRRLNEEDFEDDSVDAGEVNAGQTVTALYEVRINDDWHHSRRGGPEVATVKIRYMNFVTNEIEVDEQSINVSQMSSGFEDASRTFRLTAGVAEFAEILKGSYWAEESSFGDVLDVVEHAARTEEEREFINLVNMCISIQDH